MHILLINENPVVSRLLALCTRDEQMIVEEVTSLDSVEYKNYDIVFVDEGLYKSDIISYFDNFTIGKKVILSNTDFKIDDFDLIVKKPFLPSQIIEVLEDMLEKEHENAVSIFPLTTESEAYKDERDPLESKVLDVDELEKIKLLLEMDEKIEGLEEKLSEEELEARKVEVIKEQLIADGLEIVEEDEIVDALNSEDKHQISHKHKKIKLAKKRDKKEKKRSVDFSNKDLARIEDAVRFTTATLKRKQMKKLLKGKKIEVSIQLKEND